MTFRRARKRSQKHVFCRNIDQLVRLGIIEMMVMVGVGIEHAVFVVNGYPAKKTGICKLVQRVVDSPTRHMHAGVTDFASQTICGHMAMATIKQQPGNGNALPGGPQASVTQSLHQARFISGVCDMIFG